MYCIVNTNAVDICTEDCHTHVAICCWQFSQISTSIFHKTIRNSSLLELSKMLLYWQNSVHKVNVVVKKEKKQTGLFSLWVTMTLVLHPAFCGLYFGPDFFRVTNHQNKNSWCRFTGQLRKIYPGWKVKKHFFIHI